MWLPILAIIGGIAALVWSADIFVSGTATTAKTLGMSKILIGLTIVSIGTSAPEILVALAAALDEAPTLAIGNAIGSNIANIGLVLGITAIISPLPFTKSLLKLELPILIGASLLGLVCLGDLNLDEIDGFLLLSGLALITHLLLRSNRENQSGLSNHHHEQLDDLTKYQTKNGFFLLTGGLLILIASAWVLVWGATEIAELLGVSNLMIGLTVVAIGTSLPELAATVAFAVRGHPEIALGNVVGSNILNILAVIAVPALVSPIAIEPDILWRDYGMMLSLTLLLVIFAYRIGQDQILNRFHGCVFVVSWIGYNMVLYNQA
jgi:cation:H+ antiporter